MLDREGNATRLPLCATGGSEAARAASIAFRERYVNHMLCGRRGGALQVSRSSGLKLLPLVWQPCRKFVHSRRRQVHQQLREIELRVHVMATASSG